MRSSPLRDRVRLQQAIETCGSQTEVLLALGLRAAGGNFKALKQACLDFGLPIPVWERPTGMKAAMFKRRTPDSEIFVENSAFSNRSRIKDRLVERGWRLECAECGLGPEWNGKPLTLQLDHKNGIHNDNRMENLRLLCPNCHAQTATYCGSALRKPAKCVSCRTKVNDEGMQCEACLEAGLPAVRFMAARFENWPADDELVERVLVASFTAVARELGVSDVAIRKRLVRRGKWPAKAS